MSVSMETHRSIHLFTFAYEVVYLFFDSQGIVIVKNVAARVNISSEARYISLISAVVTVIM